MQRSLALLLCISTMSLAQVPHTLATLVGNTRALLVFAPSEDDPRFIKQQQLLEHHENDMADRNLMMIPSIPHKTKQEDKASPHKPTPPSMDKSELADVCHRLHIDPNEFTVLLLGKDGGEKLRVHTPITMARLNALIDSMPMRQEEVRDRDRK